VEMYGVFVLLQGLALGAVGCLWLLIVAFKVRTAWGVALLLFPPAALVFIPRNWRKSWKPFLLLVLGSWIAAAPYLVNYYHERYIDLGPWEKNVNGELHITLTGWDGQDYSFLQTKPTTVVLQMANPDVTDGTLVYLKGMKQLRELDLNDTQVTDEGLVILAGLPGLQELRLRGTKITDEGFRQYLSDRGSLRKLDLRRTPVKGKTKRDWKKAKEGRELLD
jgi:Leucine Rich repeat